MTNSTSNLSSNRFQNYVRDGFTEFAAESGAFGSGSPCQVISQKLAQSFAWFYSSCQIRKDSFLAP